MPPKLSATAAALVAGDPSPATAATPLRAAGRAALRRYRMEQAHLLSVPGIDSQDVGVLEEEATQFTLLAAGAPPGVPAWVAALLVQGEGRVQEQQDIAERVVRAQLQERRRTQRRVRQVRIQMETGFSNVAAQISNGLADVDDPLTPLAAPDGRPVPNFPRSRADLGNLPGPQLTSLLEAYGQQSPPRVRDRRRAFARYIGARIN